MIHFTRILVSSIVLSASLCHAGASAKLSVSATVIPFVSFTAIQNVSTYQVNGEDIRRGYVDLPGSITLRVRTNLFTGVPVVVENPGAARILVKESTSSLYGGSPFTLSTSDFHPNTPVSIPCDSRVVLPADAKEGSYPLAFSIIPSL